MKINKPFTIPNVGEVKKEFSIIVNKTNLDNILSQSRKKGWNLGYSDELELQNPTKIWYNIDGYLGWSEIDYRPGE